MGLLLSLVAEGLFISAQGSCVLVFKFKGPGFNSRLGLWYTKNLCYEFVFTHCSVSNHSTNVEYLKKCRDQKLMMFLNI